MNSTEALSPVEAYKAAHEGAVWVEHAGRGMLHLKGSTRLELINRTPGDISDEFFLALAYLNNDQATNSIPLFQKTLETAPANDNKFAEESAWFISLAYLKTGNLQAARDALLKIKEDEWRYAESRELLDKLEELK